MHHFETLFRSAAWVDAGVSLLVLAAALLAGWVTTRLLLGFLRRLAARTRVGWDDMALRHGRRPAGLIIPLLYLNLASPLLRLPGAGAEHLAHILNLLLILAVAYGLTATVRFLKDLFLARYDVTASDNLRARSVHTQVGVIEKIALAVIAVLALASMLMTIPGVRQVGVSLLASAGIAGIVIGLAAQKSIGTLLAGIQIALTQPIRVDDVVIVEGEWGRVEEITLTYVVVRIWDLRRLVLPITYFIDKPFQNWTRTSADILGTVFLHTDYTVPVEAVRAEFARLLKDHPLWDGKVCVVHVTDSRPDTLEIRLLLSTRNSGDGWELRCEVREKMVEFLQREYPGSLPRTRVELGNAGGGPGRKEPEAPASGKPGAAGGQPFAEG